MQQGEQQECAYSRDRPALLAPVALELGIVFRHQNQHQQQDHITQRNRVRHASQGQNNKDRPIAKRPCQRGSMLR